MVHTYLHTYTLALTLSISHSHTYTCTQTHTFAHTFSLAQSLSHTHTHPHNATEKWRPKEAVWSNGTEATEMASWPNGQHQARPKAHIKVLWTNNASDETRRQRTTPPSQLPEGKSLQKTLAKVLGFARVCSLPATLWAVNLLSTFDHMCQGFQRTVSV